MGESKLRTQLARRSPADGPRPVGARSLRMSIRDAATVSSCLAIIDSNRRAREVKAMGWTAAQVSGRVLAERTARRLPETWVTNLELESWH